MSIDRSFGFIEQEFFPVSTRHQFMIDYWAPEGTRIQTVADDLRALEERPQRTEGDRSRNLSTCG